MVFFDITERQATSLSSDDQNAQNKFQTFLIEKWLHFNVKLISFVSRLGLTGIDVVHSSTINKDAALPSADSLVSLSKSSSHWRAKWSLVCELCWAVLSYVNGQPVVSKISSAVSHKCFKIIMKVVMFCSLFSYEEPHQHSQIERANDFFAWKSLAHY